MNSVRHENTKLAIAGSFGWKDIGDEAMLAEHLRVLKTELNIAEDQLYLFTPKPHYTSVQHEHPLDYCFPDLTIHEPERVDAAESTRVKQALSECKALLITGGGTINTRGPSGRSLYRLNKTIETFKKDEKPYFLSGQTIGPLGEYPKHDRVAKAILEGADVACTRDQCYSKRYINMIGAKPRLLVESFDDACQMSIKDTELPENLERELVSNKTAVFNITDYTAEDESDWIRNANWIEHLLENHVDQVVLLAHTEKDYATLWVIHDMVSHHLQDRILLPDTREWTGNMLKKLISHCMFAIGGRYHFVVFAGTANIPFLGLCGNHYSFIKQNGFAAPLGLSDHIINQRDFNNEAHVKAMIDQFISKPINTRQHFAQPIASFVHLKQWIADCQIGVG